MAFYKQIDKLIISREFDLNKKEILDAGCGTGSLLIFVNEVFKPAANFGYEFSNKAIEIAMKRFPSANYEYRNPNDESGRQFDFIFCTEVLEHILNPNIPFKNLLKMMKQNAGLIITVPNGRTDTYQGHINFWSSESWNAFINENVNSHSFETGELEGYGLYAIIWN